jgi:hypothetical protein
MTYHFGGRPTRAMPLQRAGDRKVPNDSATAPRTWPSPDAFSYDPLLQHLTVAMIYDKGHPHNCITSHGISEKRKLTTFREYNGLLEFDNRVFRRLYPHQGEPHKMPRLEIASPMMGILLESLACCIYALKVCFFHSQKYARARTFRNCFANKFWQFVPRKARFCAQ